MLKKLLNKIKKILKSILSYIRCGSNNLIKKLDAVEDKQKQIRKNYGWKPDVPDERDFKFAKLNKIYSTTKLPPSVDLREFCSIVENQESLGSCTAQALVSALEYLDSKNGDGYTDLSRLFVYYNERVMEGTVNEDSGAMIRDGIKSLVKQGVCKEKLWPYNISKFKNKPSCEAYKEALNHQILEYQRLNNKNLNELKTCLADGFPFVFGFAVYESFETEEVARTGVGQLPKPNERSLGGHAVVAVGYDDSTQRFLIRNSWGEGWGVKGYFTLPYNYLINSNLADDFWMIKKGENM